MSWVVKGNVWKFGDNVSTDLIAPGRYVILDYEQQSNHTLEAIKPDFAQKVKPHDFLVAGRNFGCGSSREAAAQVLRHKKVGGVVAESFARIFFRNCIAAGLPVLVCPKVSNIFEEGHAAEVDFSSGHVRNLTTGAELTTLPLSKEIISVIEQGGIVPMLRVMFAKSE